MKGRGWAHGWRDAHREGRWGRGMGRAGRGVPSRGPPPGLADLALDHVLTADKVEWQVEQYDQVWEKDVLAAGRGVGVAWGTSRVQKTRLQPLAVQVREGAPGPGWWLEGWRGVDTRGQEGC